MIVHNEHKLSPIYINGGFMSWYPPEDDDDLFTPRKLQRATQTKDKFWDYIIVGVFIVLAIIIVSITIQAAF